MALVLLALMPRIGGEWLAGQPVVALVAVVAIGALTHIGAQLGLWRITGRAEGSERYLLAYAAALWSRLVRATARA
jgi:hypothetical protein